MGEVFPCRLCDAVLASPRDRAAHVIEDHVAGPEPERTTMANTLRCGIDDCPETFATAQGRGAHRRYAHGPGRAGTTDAKPDAPDRDLSLSPDEAAYVRSVMVSAPPPVPSGGDDPADAEGYRALALHFGILARLAG